MLGGSGFVGTSLCRLLSAAGARVTSASRSGIFRGAGEADVLQLDAEDEVALDAAFAARRPAIVFQLAGRVTGRQDLDEVLPTLRGNLLTAVNAMVLAVRRGCRRFVLAASLEEPDFNGREVSAASPYGAAKWASSVYARMFHELYGLPVALARVFIAYGPGQATREKLIPYATRELLEGRSPVIESGSRLIDWIYIDDVARGLAMLAAADGVDGATLDFGSGDLVSVADLVGRISQIVAESPAPVLTAAPTRRNEVVRRADVETTRRLIGWEPEIGLDEGLRRTVQWLQSSHAQAHHAR